MKEILFKEDGSLTEAGQKLITKYTDEMNYIFQSLIFEGATEQEIALMGTTLIKNLKEVASNCQSIARQKRIRKEKQVANNPIFSLTDEEFTQHLKDKYGSKLFFTSLTDDEYERYTPIADAAFKRYLECRHEDSQNYSLFNIKPKERF